MLYQYERALLDCLPRCHVIYNLDNLSIAHCLKSYGISPL